MLGAGAQGLSCALRLWADGWDVRVLARGRLSDTASSGAGAIWEYPPFQLTAPLEDKLRWTRESYGAFAALADSSEAAACGVRIRTSYYCFRDIEKGRASFLSAAVPPGAAPGLCEGLPPQRALRSDEFKYAYSYRAPIVHMQKYLPWLEARSADIGIPIEEANLLDVPHVAAARASHGALLVVNCLGLGAGSVFGDESLYGVLGDKVYVKAPHLEQDLDFAQLSDEDHPDGLTYVLPHGDGTLALAGTLMPVDGEYVPIAARHAGIMDRCGTVFAVPASSADVIGWWSGLRPQRPAGVRLERVEEAGGALIHDYGHGGGGVVTSWGCSLDVAALAKQIASERCAVLQPRIVPPGPLANALRARARL